MSKTFRIRKATASSVGCDIIDEEGNLLAFPSRSKSLVYVMSTIKDDLAEMVLAAIEFGRTLPRDGERREG